MTDLKCVRTTFYSLNYELKSTTIQSLLQSETCNDLHKKFDYYTQ